MGIRRVLQETASPSGKGSYDLTVKGPVGQPGTIAVVGELRVGEGSFRLWNAYPVHSVGGRILLSRDGISIPDLRGRWKNSNIGLKAFLAKPGGPPSRDLTFSAAFDLRDIASQRFDYGLPRIWRGFIEPFEFQKGKALLEVTNRNHKGRDTVEGHATFEEATVRYASMFPPLTGLGGVVSFDENGLKALNTQGTLDSSLVRIQGNLRPESESPGRELSIQAERVDWEEALLWVGRWGRTAGQKARSPLRIRVQVDQGRFREIAFRDTDATVRLNGDRMSLEKVTFVSSQGHGLITGWLHFPEEGGLSFEFHPYLVNLEVSPILMSFQPAGSKRQLTGLGSASGVIQGGGKNAQEIAQSLSGEVRFFLGEGRVAHFNVISKVFSLLDLSQLLRGNFPDLREEGMSYKTITGNVTLKDGRSSTQDLLLDADSMKTSAVGSVDILSGGLDLKLGLRRLGVGGKIVRKVPFLGEIVTNEGGGFINYYLEVRGTMAKPEVRGIPLESVREAVFGPLKKLLEKPLDVFPFQKDPDWERHEADYEQRYP